MLSTAQSITPEERQGINSLQKWLRKGGMHDDIADTGATMNLRAALRESSECKSCRAGSLLLGRPITVYAKESAPKYTPSAFRAPTPGFRPRAPAPGRGMGARGPGR